MPAAVSRGTIDSATMLRVPVIASYDCFGNTLPLYIGHNGESYKVLSATLKPGFDLKVFQCKVEIYGRVRDVTLSYHPYENVWTVPKHPRNY